MRPLAENKTFMKWSNYWDQLILHGAIPFLGLALANVKWAQQTPFASCTLIIFFRICCGMVESESTRNDLIDGGPSKKVKSKAGDDWYHCIRDGHGFMIFFSSDQPAVFLLNPHPNIFHQVNTSAVGILFMFLKNHQKGCKYLPMEMSYRQSLFRLSFDTMTQQMFKIMKRTERILINIQTDPSQITVIQSMIESKILNETLYKQWPKIYF